MKPEEAASLVGHLVRLTSKSGRSKGFIIARLHAVTKHEALVTPQNHKKQEWVPIERVRRWVKGDRLQELQRTR